MSFVDVLVQKGYQLKGIAELISPEENKEAYQVMQDMAGAKYKVLSVISVQVDKVKPILAPSYLFYPDTDEAVKIAEVKREYLLKG